MVLSRLEEYGSQVNHLPPCSLRNPAQWSIQALRSALRQKAISLP